MKFLRESIDKEIQFAKSQRKKQLHQKNNRLFRINNQLFIQFANIKTEFKEIKDRENAHRCLYWFTLNPELHPVFSETTEKFH